MSEYQPGACNIGATQRRARRLAGIGSFAVAGAMVLAATVGVLPAGVLPATAPFVFGGWVGVLQDYYGFCVAFGALARYDLSGSGGTAGSVADSEAVRADRRQALRILVFAAVMTVATVGVVVLLGTAL